MSSTRGNVRYRVLRPIGAGGMAEVSLGHDEVLGRWVALKRVSTASGASRLKRLRREALVGASLSHPNLVSVYDVQEEAGGEVVIVMEYVAGDTLQEVIRSSGALPAARALRILEGVARALDAVHARGIVHRDVKPANILLGINGAIKLADLGIASVGDGTKITTAGEVLGTFSYMSPEQLEGKPSSAAMDIYALAAVAFEMLCGRRARQEPNPLAMAHAIATRPPPDIRQCWPKAPPATAELLKRAMALEPAKRPRSAGELVGRLRASLDPETTQAEAVPIPRRPPIQPAPVEPAGSQRRRAANLAHAQIAAAAPQRRESRANGSAAPAPAPPAPAPGERRHVGRLAALGLLAALAVIGIVVAAVSSGGGKKTTAQRPRHVAAPTTATSRTSSGSSSREAPAPTPRRVPQTTAMGSGFSAAPATPAGAVQAFYENAARHRYAAAWQLADDNMRRQLEGFDSFQAQMSRVRFITFHRARTVAARGSSLATVALETTAVLVDRTQRCAGTAQTLHVPSGVWLLDHISISCAPE